MQVLITNPTFVPGDEQPQMLDTHTIHTCDRDIARRLVDADKALYIDQKDDPYKGQRTVSESRLAAIVAALEQKAKAEPVKA